jgi:hypothetical protein
MAISQLEYRLSERKVPNPAYADGPQEQGYPRIERAPNKKSLAKKKWLAEKKARERGE